MSAVEAVGLPHLIYISPIGSDCPIGVPLLDAKRRVEQLLAAGTTPWSSLRTGSYIDDIIDTVHASGAWPLTALQFLKPLIRQTDPRLASIITLLSYFARNDWTSHADQLDRVLPGSRTTSVEAHLRAVLTAPGFRSACCLRSRSADRELVCSESRAAASLPGEVKTAAVTTVLAPRSR